MRLLVSITEFCSVSLSVVSKEAAEGQAGDAASPKAGEQSIGYATVFFEDTIEGQVESLYADRHLHVGSDTRS